MNSADVFSLEFDMLTRTSALAKTLEWFRSSALARGDPSATAARAQSRHQRALAPARSGGRRGATARTGRAWHELLAVPALAFDQGRAFLDDLRALGLNSLDSVSLTPLPQTIAMAAYAHYQLVERATVGLVGYLWFFERMPRLVYPLWSDSCRRGGVPDKALRALAQGAVRRLRCATRRSPTAAGRSCDGRATSASRRQSLHDTAELFATMVDAALQRAERRLAPAGGQRSPSRGIGQVA